MSDLLRDYIDEFKEFLPKTYKSSPISKSVKVKDLEVMVKRLSFSASLYDSEKLRLRILANEPFELGLLPEVIVTLKRNFTYYKWEKVGSDYELTLYKEKPQRDMWYRLNLALFVGGYITSILLAFASLGLLYYFFYLLDTHSTKPTEVVQPPIWFEIFSMLFMTTLMVSMFIEIYLWLFRKTSVAQFLRKELYFGKIENIDEPTVL